MTIGDGLLQRFLANHPGEAGLVLENHSPTVAADILSGLPDQAIAAALTAVTPGFAVAVLSQWETEKISKIFALLDPPSCSRLLRPLRRPVRTEIVALLPEHQRSRVTGLLQYESNTAGALMDPNPPVVREDDKVDRSLRRIQEESARSMPYLYVLDDQLTLRGVLTTSELVKADPEDLIRSHMTPVTEIISPKAGPREVLDHPGWRSLRALPVVDRQSHLLGVVRFETYSTLLAKLRGTDAGTEVSTVEALGDLFFTGLSGFFEAATRSGTPSRTTSRAVVINKQEPKREKGQSR